MGRSLNKSRNHKPVTIRRKVKKMRRLNYHDQQVAASWDLKRTLRQNYAAIGLRSDPNAWNDEQDLEVPEDAPELVPPKEKPKRAPRLTHGEVTYFAALIDKYGDDYRKMSRDIKLNYYQHSKGQLKKKCEIYMEYYMGGRFDPVHGSARDGQPGQRRAELAAAARASSADEEDSDDSDCVSEEEAVEGIFQESSDDESE
mmetsp:Transcript_1653/g.5874  ORF Transcript_1653/g.5874 Transcript_1653/m.5874 type:complete len:200 (+) Transcript_1653:38-637(+)